MAVVVVHPFVNLKADGADATVARPSDWNADHTVTGLGTAAEADSTDFATAAQGLLADSAVQPADLSGYPTPSAANTWTAQNTFAAGTITTSQPLTITQTFNAGGVTFTGIFANFTDTASAAGSLMADLQVGGVSQIAATKNGRLVFVANASSSVPSIDFGSGNGITYFGSGILFREGGALGAQLKGGTFKLGATACFGITSSTGDPTGSAASSMGRPGLSNAFVFADTTSAAVAGGTTSRVEANKAITAIADATATTVFTVTVPNASHSAMIEVNLTGKIGAGGAIGAGEATGTISYQIAIARTAGVNAVATISAAYGSAVCAVAGATTITVAGTLGAITGAVGASNTFTIQVTVTKGGGASANHTCLAYARLMNANSSGISIA